MASCTARASSGDEWKSESAPRNAVRIRLPGPFRGEIGLPPVSLYQDIAAPPVNPAMSYPVGMRPRRLFPTSLGPNVRVAIPTLVSGNPNMGAARRRSPPFDDHMGRRDANENIGRCRENHRPCKNQSDQSFKNHNSSLPTIGNALIWPHISRTASLASVHLIAAKSALASARTALIGFERNTGRARFGARPLGPQSALLAAGKKKDLGI